MPITAGTSLLKSQIETALNMQEGANISTTATLIASAIAAVAPMGIFPSAPTPVSLSPVGLSAGKALIQTALSLGVVAQQRIVAQLFAQGVSLIAPTAPPAGLAMLANDINSALNMGEGASQSVIATLFSQAIISYFSTGGVL